MQYRRAVGAATTVLLAIVAILGTAMYFVTGHTLPFSELKPPTQMEQQSGSTIPISPSTNTALPAGQESASSSNYQSESIKVTNVHAWVNANGTSVTAFAVQNTGSKAATISSISMRGLSVPTTSWNSCTTACATSTNINTDLSAQYSPLNSIKLPDNTFWPMASGPISLTQGQATIVYVSGAGNLASIDAGNTYSLQMQSGQAIAVQQVQVLTK